MKRRHCRHDRLRGIYGDEINHTPKYARSECLDCGKFFPELPTTRARANGEVTAGANEEE